MILFLAGAFIGAIAGFLLGLAAIALIDRAVTLPW